MKIFSRIFATFFGVGYFPIAPGTAASALVVLIYRYFIFPLNIWVIIGGLVILFFFGVAVSASASAFFKKEDPRPVVIDEVAGQMIPLILLPPDWRLLIAAFLLFRLFDILKPFPIRSIENFPKGWGIMSDDIAAGLYAGILINIGRLLLRI